MYEIPEKMRAVTLTGVNGVEVAEYATPKPKAGEVLIKMAAASICTIDQRAYNGVSKGNFPTVPGHEGVGVIVAMGEGVKGLELGDMVVCGRFGCGACKNCISEGLDCLRPSSRFDFKPEYGIWGDIGCMAEYNVRDYLHVTKISKDVNPIYASICEPVSCVVRSVKRSRLKWTETAVITGAGIMGLLHVQLCHLKGARVIVSEIDPIRRQKALEFGADYAVNPMEVDIVEFVNSVTDGGADVVFNTVASTKVFAQCVDMVGPLGRIVAYTSLHPDAPVPLPIGRLHKKEYEIIGTNGSSLEDFFEAARLIENGRIRLETLVDGTFAIDDCVNAFNRACAPDSYRCVFDFSK